jgi:hypothetical protein
VISSCIVPRDTRESAAASGNTGTRMCIARVPVAVTATRIQNGARPLRARTGVLSQLRYPTRATLIRCQFVTPISRGKPRARKRPEENSKCLELSL